MFELCEGQVIFCVCLLCVRRKEFSGESDKNANRISGAVAASGGAE